MNSISLDFFGAYQFYVEHDLAKGHLLTVANTSSPLLDRVKTVDGDIEIFLSTDGEEIPVGSPISICYEARYRKPPIALKAEFDKIKLVAGTILNIVPLFGEPESLFLTVDFRHAGKKEITIVKTDPSRIFIGKSVIALANLKGECRHDQTAALICYKNILGQNIPFISTAPVADGTRFII